MTRNESINSIGHSIAAACSCWEAVSMPEFVDGFELCGLEIVSQRECRCTCQLSQTFCTVTANDSVIILIQFGESFLHERDPPGVVLGHLCSPRSESRTPRSNWQSVININISPIAMNIEFESENALRTVIALVYYNFLYSLWDLC